MTPEKIPPPLSAEAENIQGIATDQQGFGLREELITFPPRIMS
jgi:hypothetical protein